MNPSFLEPPGWTEIAGLSFSAENFRMYCQSLQWVNWKPSLLILHNTAAPTLAQRPAGLTLSHIHNLEAYYRNIKKWTAGPHLFIDDKQIWVFTPLTTPGVHSPSWNGCSIGIEMLGNYETESFSKGRGLLVQQHTISAIVSLIEVLQLHTDQVRLHREDPLTTHACPGKNVEKAKLLQAISIMLLRRRAIKSLSKNI